MTILVVDANSLVARCYFAAKSMKMDVYTDTLRLSAITLLNLLNPEHTKFGATITHSACCWDAGANKSKHREPKPQEYYDLMALSRDLFALLIGTVNIEQDPYEGDDLVASVVYAADKTTDTVVASSDKDLMQLIEKHVSYYSFHEKCILTDNFVCNKFNVKHPNQIGLALAIQGDAADDISGVKRWGAAKVKKIFSNVNKNMPFDEVLNLIESNMNSEQHEQFIASLERTLLNSQIPVPAPAPIVFPDESEIDMLGIPEISRKFAETKFMYEIENIEGGY